MGWDDLQFSFQNHSMILFSDPKSTSEEPSWPSPDPSPSSSSFSQQQEQQPSTVRSFRGYRESCEGKKAINPSVPVQSALAQAKLNVSSPAKLCSAKIRPGLTCVGKQHDWIGFCGIFLDSLGWQSRQSQSSTNTSTGGNMEQRGKISPKWDKRGL